jgi:hypothetical protein
MNKIDNTKQVQHGILLLKCLHLPNRHNNDYIIRNINIKTSKSLLQTLYHGWTATNHETAGFFPVKYGD